MKRLVLLTLAASAALVSASCSKSYDMTEEPISGGIQVVADVTRTTNDGMHTLWAASDAINLFYAPAGTTTYSSNYKYSTSVAGTSATFTGDITGLGTDKLDWYALYPYSNKLSTPANTSCYFNIGCSNSASNAQVQNGNDNMAHLAGQYFPLVAKVANWDPATSDNSVALSFKPVPSVVKFVVKNSTTKPLTILSAEMTAEEDIIGSYYIDFAGENPTFTPSGATYVSKTAKLNVSNGTAIAVGSTASFYLAIKPFATSGEKTYKFSVNGYEKSVNLTDAQFAAGAIKTVNFNFDQEEKDFSGTYVVLAKNNTSYYAMSGNPGSYTYMPKVDFTYDGTASPVEVSNPEIVWTVAKTDDGYTFKCKSNDKCLSYSGNSNAAYVLETADSTCYMNVLQQNDGTFAITNKVQSSRRLRYNTTSPRFAFYTGTTGTGDLMLVKASYSSSPILNPITNPSKVAVGGATGVAVTYTVTNPVAGRVASASTSATWIKNFDCATYGTITFDVDASAESSERSADVTVSYEGTADVKFTVTQEGSAGPTSYTVLFGSSYNSGKVGSYTNSWYVNVDGVQFLDMVNWNNNNNGWNYVKAGGKSGNLTGTMTTHSALPLAVGTVKVTIDNIVTGSVTSLTLYVSSDSAFPGTGTTSYSVPMSTGEKSVTITAPAKNRYYKLEAVCTQNSSTNGLITISKVVFE